MGAEQRARSCVLLQHATYGQGDRLGLIATRQLVGRFLDQGNDFRPLNYDYVRHRAGSFVAERAIVEVDGR